MTYAEDSFFSLTQLGQLGLIVLSAVLTVVMVWLTWRLTRHLSRRMSILLVLFLFWLFVWLSPQAYYTYYMLLFDDLPVQVVVKAPPGAGGLLKLMTFTAADNLSAHGKGIMVWMMVIAALWRQRQTATV